MKNNKINGLQMLRGLAAISVILTHNWSDIGGPIAKILGMNVIGGFGVDIFFVLSGFIMSYTLSSTSVGGINNSINFLMKRIKRIYPIYIIASLPLLILAIVMKKIGWLDVLGNILLLPTFTGDKNYHMILPQAWTLVYEMLFYCIFAFSILVAKEKRQVVLLSSIIILTSILISQLQQTPAEKLNWVNFNFIMGDSLMINFVLGAIYGTVFQKINIKISNKLIVILSTSLFLYGHITYLMGGDRFLSLGIPSFIIVVLFSLFTAHESKLQNKLVFFGDASYSIYLTHIYFSIVANYIVKQTGMHADIIGLIATLLAVVSGCIFYKVIEVKINHHVNGVTRKEVKLTT